MVIVASVPWRVAAEDGPMLAHPSTSGQTPAATSSDPARMAAGVLTCREQRVWMEFRERHGTGADWTIAAEAGDDPSS